MPSQEIKNFYEVSRLRASPRHGGAMRFRDFVTDPPRGRPSGGGGVHHNGSELSDSHLVFRYRETLSFKPLFIRSRLSREGLPPQGPTRHSGTGECAENFG